MKDLRKTLQKHIYETIRLKRLPFFIGLKGIGKHYAIEAYCHQYHLKCENLNHQLPKNKETIYICDDFTDMNYIKQLSNYLKKKTTKYVSFQRHYLSLKCMNWLPID